MSQPSTITIRCVFSPKNLVAVGFMLGGRFVDVKKRIDNCNDQIVLMLALDLLSSNMTRVDKQSAVKNSLRGRLSKFEPFYKFDLNAALQRIKNERKVDPSIFGQGTLEAGFGQFLLKRLHVADPSDLVREVLPYIQNKKENYEQWLELLCCAGDARLQNMDKLTPSISKNYLKLVQILADQPECVIWDGFIDSIRGTSITPKQREDQDKDGRGGEKTSSTDLRSQFYIDVVKILEKAQKAKKSSSTSTSTPSEDRSKMDPKERGKMKV